MAQKIGAVETTADFFKRRAAAAQPADLTKLLANAPDVPPEPGDEVPDFLLEKLRQAGLA